MYMYVSTQPVDVNVDYITLLSSNAHFQRNKQTNKQGRKYDYNAYTDALMIKEMIRISISITELTPF